MQPDESPVWQSQRGAAYQSALDRLIHEKRCYPCACSRKDLASAGEPLGLGHTRHGELVYPGTCRDGLRGQSGRSWRLHTGACGESTIYWNDRRLGAQFQDVQKSVGDFVLFRADACFAYQLAVVVDDAAQGITHVVRGQDLCDNTARQILLQRALGLHQPIYLHTPLVFGADGQKLSKQNGATPVDTSSPARALLALRDAAAVLGLGPADSADSPAAALRQWTQQWRESVVTAVPA
jgi:glutamyl-Q tRNA(Asp) synthetase